MLTHQRHYESSMSERKSGTWPSRIWTRIRLCITLNLFSTQAIHGYRETERLQWGAKCESILRRVRVVAFPEGSPLLGPIHVLDLDKEGYIKPHIDSVKVCLWVICTVSFSTVKLFVHYFCSPWTLLSLVSSAEALLQGWACYPIVLCVWSQKIIPQIGWTCFWAGAHFIY